MRTSIPEKKYSFRTWKLTLTAINHNSVQTIVNTEIPLEIGYSITIQNHVRDCCSNSTQFRSCPSREKRIIYLKKKKKFVHSLFTLRWIKSFIKSNIERMREIYNCIIFLYIPALQFFYLFFINCLICCLPIWYL